MVTVVELDRMNTKELKYFLAISSGEDYKLARLVYMYRQMLEEL